MIEDIKKMALEAYVLHLIMWEELSDPKFYHRHEVFMKLHHEHEGFMSHHLKRNTVAMKLNGAKTCEFCSFTFRFGTYNSREFEFLAKQYSMVAKHANNCHLGICPSKVGFDGGCLGGLYAKWEYCEDVIKRAKIARKIRDIELADWFKELLK